MVAVAGLGIVFQSPPLDINVNTTNSNINNANNSNSIAYDHSMFFTYSLSFLLSLLGIFSINICLLPFLFLWRNLIMLIFIFKCIIYLLF